MYWDYGFSQSDIAGVCGVDDSTISRWMSKLKVPTEFSDWVSTDGLDAMYNENKMSTREIADIYDVGADTVLTALRKNGVGPRERLEYQKYLPAQYYTHEGYEVWVDGSDGTNDTVKVHRLLAVSEFGFDNVVGKDVHHTNSIPFDNRPDNIEVLTKEEHGRRNVEQGNTFWEESPR